MGNFHDGYLVQGEPLGMVEQDFLLTADNTAIILNPKTALLRLQSNDTTAANRTFTLTPGYKMGQQLMLVFVSAGGTSAQLQDAGNVALSADWEPTQYDTLNLVWIGDIWVEIARSDN